MFRVNQSLAKTAASVNYPSARPPRLIQIDAPFSSRLSRDSSAFALTYSLRLRSCKSMDAFVISSLPSLMLETLQMAGPLRSADITPLHRYYGPSRHLSSSADFPVSPVIRPTLLRRFRAGPRRASPVA